jgi:hypothetical protein
VALADIVQLAAQLCGHVLQLQWRQRMQDGVDSSTAPAPARGINPHTTPTTNLSISSSSSSSSMVGPSMQQTAVVTQQEVGVAKGGNRR